MNVLSLFDGMSCGQIALSRLDFPVENYYASEIDKYAIKTTMKNFPNTIQMGNVIDIDPTSLPSIDLLLGGSPCQGFSIAGKHLNFDDPRSALFFEYVRLLKALKPKYFLLENVMMKQEFQDIISEQLGVQPVKINSALVSAQNRKRLYWTNIPFGQLEDQSVDVVDITEDGSEKVGAYRGRYNADGSTSQQLEVRKDNKSNTLTTVQKDNVLLQPEDLQIKLKDILENESEGIIKSHGIFKDKNEKSQCIDANYFKGADNHGQRTLLRPVRIGTIGNGGQGERIYSIHGKSVTLSALGGGRGAKTGLYKPNETIRKLTPTECERLQTVPDGYTEGVSNTQRYKMLGNGWTIKVIEHILKGMK